MIQFTRITRTDDRLLNQLLPLYVDAFPRMERRDPEQLKWMTLHRPEMVFNAVKDGNELAGFFIYWNMPGFYYLEHFAICEPMRNRKIGRQVLQYIAENLQGLRLLEVKPPIDELSIRRVAYYERNGYEVLERTYMQPSYDTDEDAHMLWVMGNYATFRLPEFLECVKAKVYADNYNWVSSE